jgi:LAGLIDADG DNA endonuclease family
MDDGSRSGKGLKLSTNSFTYEENCDLATILRKKYKLKVSIHKTGVQDRYCIYIHKGSVVTLYETVKYYLHPSMKYKFAL